MKDSPSDKSIYYFFFCGCKSHGLVILTEEIYIPLENEVLRVTYLSVRISLPLYRNI